MPRHKKNYKRKPVKKFANKSKSKNDTPANRRKKNFRFIQRSKEAEEFLRRQKTVEDQYKLKSGVTANIEEDESDEEQVEEENPFESLLSALNKDGKSNNLIESSSEEEMEVEEEMGEEEEGDDEIASIDSGEEDVYVDESDGSDDDDDGDQHVEDNNDEAEEVESEAESDEETRQDTKPLNSSDAFSQHFENELSQQHLDNLLAKPCPVKNSVLLWPLLGKLSIEIPKSQCETTTTESTQQSKNKKILNQDEVYASEGSEPDLLTKDDIKSGNWYIRKQISKNIHASNEFSSKTSAEETLSPLQREIISIISKYQDLSYPNRTLTNAEEIRFTYCLHAINHMLTTRAKILHHNAKIQAATNSKKSSTIIPDTYRDQGLARPKVLIMLPFRDSAYKTVNLFVNLLYGEKADTAKTDGTVINYKRFEEEYTGNTLYFPKTNPKPEDYEKTFAGNTDDNFRIGISLTKKCIKLYTDFYSSDILIASPLGLRMVVGAAGDAERDYDFLTSIEILILDQAEMFLAQNWDHLLHVLDHLHLQPQSVRNTDFSRVRPWCLNGLSRFYRQTLLFTSHELPEFRSLFKSKCSNYRGKVRVVNPIFIGSIRNVIVHIPQTFHKINVDSIENSFEQRFKYFTNEILPQFKGPSMSHCMIYVPSYFDYVRIRNYFKSETINCVQICEYTKDAKIARARDMFFHSAAHFLLYSERAHFFRRTRIKGIRHLIMYQPPSWPHFYPEMINLMQESCQNPRDGLESSMSVTMLYTKYDMIQVSAIVGTAQTARLLQANKSTHVFTACD